MGRGWYWIHSGREEVTSQVISDEEKQRHVSALCENTFDLMGQVPLALPQIQERISRQLHRFFQIFKYMSLFR